MKHHVSEADTPSETTDFRTKDSSNTQSRAKATDSTREIKATLCAAEEQNLNKTVYSSAVLWIYTATAREMFFLGFLAVRLSKIAKVSMLLQRKKDLFIFQLCRPPPNIAQVSLSTNLETRWGYIVHASQIPYSGFLFFFNTRSRFFYTVLFLNAWCLLISEHLVMQCGVPTYTEIVLYSMRACVHACVTRPTSMDTLRTVRSFGVKGVIWGSMVKV